MPIHKVRIHILELFTKPDWREDAEMLRLAVNGQWQDREILHGHDSSGRSAYRFPLIRYVPRKNPVIVGLEGSLDAMEDVYASIGQTIRTPGSTYEITASELRGEDFDFGESSDLIEMSTISPWVGLNTDNYSKYIRYGQRDKKIALLESIWKGNVLSLAKGLGIDVDWRIMAKIVEFHERRLTVKGTPVLGFAAKVVTNTVIPNWLGIGKHASLGFGRWGD